MMKSMLIWMMAEDRYGASAVEQTAPGMVLSQFAATGRQIRSSWRKFSRQYSTLRTTVTYAAIMNDRFWKIVMYKCKIESFTKKFAKVHRSARAKVNFCSQKASSSARSS